jgi:PTH1 family peptidyl-tRNA hydrolase
VLLLVGLGNPGAEYARHRHNVGFMAVERIVARHGFGPARSRFMGQVNEGVLAGGKVLALRPTTFMNESGRAVNEAARFYKLTPADIVVLHDELDLAPGKLRVKRGGGLAGHNGLKSIERFIGPDFRRVRIGIGHPGHKDAVQRYVLHDFAKVDRDWLEPLLDAVAEAAPLLARGGDAAFASRVALLLNPPANFGGKASGA